MKRLKHSTTENLIYLFIWVVVFVLPVFAIRENGVTDWFYVRFYWVRMLPLLVLFLINNYLLVPRLLLRKRYLAYLASVLGAMLVVFSAHYYGIRSRYGFPHKPIVLTVDSLPGDSVVVTTTLIRPFEKGESRARPARPHPEDMEQQRDAMAPGPGRRPPVGFREEGPDFEFRRHAHMVPLLNNLLLGMLIIGFNIAIRYLFKSMRDERQIKELESHTLQAELNYLKTQINPHFFMNTLNNIHALIDFDTEKAKETVIELSKIMRYVLYDADQTTVPLSREVQFLNNYVELMRIRFTDEVDIRVEFQEELPDVKVPPVLLVTLIENAFKHGISYRRDSFVHSRLWSEGGKLCFTVSNSVTDDLPPSVGVGMDNMRKRLSLLYGERFTLEVKRTAEKYSVTLIIPV